MNNEENNEETIDKETVKSGEEKLVEQTNEEKPVDEFKSKYEEVNDKFMRLYSEFDNYKKRSARERIELLKTAGGDVIKTILPVLDDFERAMKANENVDDPKAIKEGFVLIHQKLIHALQKNGLKKMDVIGQVLNTELQEAITQIPAPKEELKGKVVDVVEQGYYLNDAVLRHAKVVVGG